MNDHIAKLEDVATRDYAEAWDELDDVSAQFAQVRPRRDRQLNLRVDAELLASLREAAARSGEGYHTLARRLIEEGLARVLEDLPAAKRTATPFRSKEVLLALLGAKGAAEENEAVIGKTRLQKLLFLVAQHLQEGAASRFEAYSYGPFDEAVGPDLDFLAGEGLVEASDREPPPVLDRNAPDRADRVIDWIWHREDRTGREVESVVNYRLTKQGMVWLEEFVRSDAFGSAEAKQRLLTVAEEIKSRYGRVPLEDLVDEVYAAYPSYAERSKIRDQVAARRARKAAHE